MTIIIETVDHDKQRYNTTGDWYYDNPSTLRIVVSKLGNEKYEMLVAIHETIEALLCKWRAIKQAAVDKFDIAFEEARKQATEGEFAFHGQLFPENMEPGDCHMAPYYQEHQFATGIERTLAAFLGVVWVDYEKAVWALDSH
jgi:hypothetical protein